MTKPNSRKAVARKVLLNFFISAPFFSAPFFGSVGPCDGRLHTIHVEAAGYTLRETDRKERVRF
jgi:hypothetical protein